MWSDLLDSFQTAGYMPHGHCYLWKPWLIGLHVVSDTTIVLAYYAIPITLIYFIFKKRNVPFNWLVLLFALFIFGCGTTHLVEIINVWETNYVLAGFVKLFTAIVSVITAILLIPVIPKLLTYNNFSLAFMSHEEMQLEIERLRKINQELIFSLEQKK